MNELEFQNFFAAVFGGIPEYAQKSITEYLATGIESEILVSDDAANQAQQKGTLIPAAALVATDTNWHFVFRPFLRNAPPDKLRSIIQHEIVHAFLISVESHPNEPAQTHVHQYHAELEAQGKSLGLKLPDRSDLVEDLVCFINDDWGADDLAAKMWLQNELKLEDVGI